jgi:hypothetical protein
MSFVNYDLLLSAIEHERSHRSRQPAYLRIVRREPRSRPTNGRPRSLPRGRPTGPPEAT